MTDFTALKNRINGFAELSTAEKVKIGDKIDASANTGNILSAVVVDATLVKDIKEILNTAAPAGPLWGSTGLSGSSSRISG
ncbi:hypothetical protein PROFUN_10839 [Planoprotostelium fungivorum]|uniref:Uncharacterized protein n=1 Tax=Planoprotostelium fungivorum TaxID=1890364 RepID=A0A2P6NCQ3_9EUKA|nr:hypothetical protein PROFUN_10839 [Planoprotostelium fungivorum]